MVSRPPAAPDECLLAEAELGPLADRPSRSTGSRGRQDPPIGGIWELTGASSAALLAGLVHEMRTPVSALATGSELLLDDLDQLDRDDVRRIVETMHRGAIWLQRLVENVLYAATAADGGVRMYLRPVNLVELARDVVPVVEPLLRQRRQTLRLVDRLAGLRVDADSRRIGQVLINLIANASKYSAPASRIVVTVARRADHARVSVADRGSGLPAGGADALFAAYARAPEAGRSGIDGTGLGLAVVKSIVDLHGGNVGATRRRGGGATFWIDLPLSNRPATDTMDVLRPDRERLA